MSRHGDAGLDASRVVSRRPRPASASPFGARVIADDVHQRADGELRQMAEVREQPIVLVGVDDARNGAESPDTNALERRPVRRRSSTGFGVSSHGRSVEQIRPRGLHAAGRRARERMAADERQPSAAVRAPLRGSSRLVLPTSVTTARSACSGSARSAADVLQAPAPPG